eukprot:gene3900-932_t
MPLPPHAALSTILSATIGTLPWVGQGTSTAPPSTDPPATIFFDGVFIPNRGAFAAAFAPPSTAVLTTAPHPDQQHAELSALHLALQLAATLGLHELLLVGDNTCALHASTKLSCPSHLHHRTALLRQLAQLVLSSNVRFHVHYIPGKFTPPT